MEKIVRLEIIWSGTVEYYLSNQRTEVEIIVDFPENADLNDLAWLSQEDVGEEISTELTSKILADFEEAAFIIIDEMLASLISIEDVE